MTLETRISRLYEDYKAIALQEKNPEIQLQLIQALIHFCWMNYPLLFSDPVLDDQVDRLSLPDIEIEKTQSDHEVYIASSLMEVGGHTRCLLNLISHQPAKKHTVILTRQSKPLSENMIHVFEKYHVQCVVLKSKAGLIKTATTVQELIKEISPERIFLFHHADDMIPVLALAKSKRINTILYNHSDHVFSVGAKYFSRNLEFRSAGADVSLYGRDIKKVSLHPLPISKTDDTISKQQARIQLGLHAQGFIIGTLTNVDKARPIQGSTSMITWINQLAIKYPLHTFLIIGLNTHQFEQWSLNQQVATNVVCVGIQPNPELYYRAMDFFLEPFPVGSGLGIIEAAAYGAIPIFTPHATRLTSTYEVLDVSLRSILKQHKNLQGAEEEIENYLCQTKAEIQEKSNSIESLVNQKHRGAYWLQQLEESLKVNQLRQSISESFIKEESRFFQVYQQKTSAQLLTYLLSNPFLSTPKHLFRILRFHRYLFAVKNWSQSNIKRLLIRLFKKSNP